MLPLSVRLKDFVAGVFFLPPPDEGALGGPEPVWVQLGPPLPPREGAVFRTSPFKIK
jgi:hypothetical protein